MKPEDAMTQPTEQEELEARVLAMLLGESDPEERAVVEALLEENAELQVYREQTEGRLGLLDEASRDKASLEADPLRLDSERRAELEKLLACELTDGERKQEGTVTPFEPVVETTETKNRKWVRFLPLAAAAAVVTFAGIMARFVFDEDETGTNMAQVDEKSPLSVVTIKSKEKGARRESANMLKEKALPNSPPQTDAFSEIAMPETASLDQIPESSLIQTDELEKLLPNLETAAAESAQDILNKRVAVEIAAINDSHRLGSESQSNQLEDELKGRFAANGFAFGGEVDGFTPAAGDKLLARDSAGASSVLPTPSGPATPRGPGVLLATAEPAPFPVEPEPEAEIADFESAPTSRPASDSSVKASSVEKPDTGKKNDKSSLKKGFEDREATERNLHVKELLEENIDANEGRANRFPQLRAKSSEEEEKRVPSKPISGAIAAPGKLEGNLALQGFADASYSSEDKLEREEGKTRQASALIGEDLGTVPPPLPTPPNPEVSAAEQPFSTFSPKVGDVSFRLAETSLKQGQWPVKATIRSEEFVNAFDYRKLRHARGENLAFSMERARHPFVKDREILRFSLGAATTKEQHTSPLNLVIALDNSASMKRVNSSGLVSKILQELAKHLTGADRVSLVTFAQQPKLRLDNLPGNELRSSLDSISKLIPEKGTNLEKALDLGFAAAHVRYFPKGSNRVLLLSDGAANLGERVPRALKAKVDKHRAHGIVLDCIGLGSTSYVDHMLDSVSGNGRYGFLDDVSEADDALGRKLAGILRPTVSELKVQVEFNPDRVELYRQLGYEKDQLGKQYFDEKSIGGGEIANGEAVNALYFVKLNPKGKGDLGVLRVRYKELKTGDLRQREWKLPYESGIPAFVDASASMRLAIHAATFAEWLADSPHGAGFVIERSIGELQAISNDLPDKASVDRLSEMMARAQNISR